ncbi:hypothetical protein JJQ72_00380 [Paenibacillus sp. F411]|uniref:hypothetical protein n=1 Tax=Paenibacillus sp. F411 TaxID=2820239 RepID=UPI001AAE51B6|nr:hypothetical protein [Paenibacillus sp. F411]MBO2942445.1 hypothetical protein [Paenibacillus sp. F411]
MKKPPPHDDTGFLFNVDILVKSPSNAFALQQLLQTLNQDEQIIDFRIKSGIELGEIIDQLLQSKKKAFISKAHGKAAEAAVSGSEPKAAASPKSSEAAQRLAPPAPSAVTLDAAAGSKPVQPPKGDPKGASAAVDSNPYKWITDYAKDNRLVRMTTNRQGKQFSLPCRILNFDESKQLVTVYHVDEKQVYTFNVNEIDEFRAG